MFEVYKSNNEAAKNAKRWFGGIPDDSKEKD